MYKNSKASVLQGSALFKARLSHLYVITVETIAFTTQTYVVTTTTLLYNTLAIQTLQSFLRSRCLNFVAAVPIHSDFGAQENKICH